MTSLNRSRACHIDGASNEISMWFLKSTNLQIARVKIEPRRIISEQINHLLQDNLQLYFFYCCK